MPPTAADRSPTIGIAIPYFSRADFLREALASVVSQDDPDFVALVVDDCSLEGGAEAAVEAIDDPRIGYVRNPANLGLARNFNVCLRALDTDVVAIVHADDLLEPSFVSTIRAAHRDHPDAACVAVWTTPVDAAGQPRLTLVDRVKHRRWPAADRFLLRGDAGLARLMHTFFIYTPAVSYRPALLPPDPFPDRWRQVMDVDLYASLLLGGGAILLDRAPSYRYRRHDETTTRRNAREFTRLHEDTALAREVARRARQLGWRRTSFAARLRWSNRLNGAVALVGSMRGGGSGRLAALRDVVDPR